MSLFSAIGRLLTGESAIEAIDKKIFPPVAGERWEFHKDTGDPFPSKTHKPVVIIDVKSGWVRYKLNSLFNDERKEIDLFLNMYRRL